MKKVFIVLFLFIMVAIPGVSETLHIYSWSDYIPEDVIESFENAYNCKVIYDTYDSNETMYAKLKAGATGYDIAFPSGDYTEIMIRENMLISIDKNKIPNFSYLDSDVLKMITYDPDNEYSVPYQLGSTGIAVNTFYVDKYEKSWSIYQREDLKGKTTLLDDMREVFGAALKYLGYSVNTTNTEHLQQAKEVILKWEDNIVKFDNEVFAKGVISGEFWVVHGYGENIYYEGTEEELKNIEFFIPEEGSTLWIDNMVILKGARNVELAHKFINYVLDPKVSATISDYLLLPSIVPAAEQYIEEERIYTVKDLHNCEMINDLGENLKLYNKLWNEIRFGLW